MSKVRSNSTVFLMWSLIFVTAVGSSLPASGDEQSGWQLHSDPDKTFSPRDSMGHVVHDGRIWLLGGYTPQRVHDVWSSDDGADWTPVTSAAPWGARNVPGAVVYNGRMWIMGGVSAAMEPLNDVWSSADGVRWTRATAAADWSPRGVFQPVVFQDKMWVLGGIGAFDGTHHHHDVWTSTDGMTWTQVTSAAPWAKRGGHVTLVHDGKMWVIGGGVYNENEPNNIGAEYNDVWVTDDGVNWTRVLEHAPFDGRRFAGATVYDGRMWVVGGVAQDDPEPWHNANRNDVWFSEDGATWTQLAEVPWGPRHAPAVVTFRDQLWVIGGFANGPLLNESWSYRAAPERRPGASE